MPTTFDRNGEIAYRGGISYPEAYRVPKGTDSSEIDKIKPPIIKADSERATNRPNSDLYDYLCPGCLAPMHWVMGARKKSQPDKSSTQPNYGKPFFRHNPKTLDQHHAKSGPVLVADLAVVIDNIAAAKGWTYENLETYSTTARRIALTNPTAPGQPLVMEFIIAPNRTMQIPADFDGVVVTTTGQMAEGHRALVLRDAREGILTAEKLHAILTSRSDDPGQHPANAMLVSGIVEVERMPTEEFTDIAELQMARSRQRFIHHPRNLATAMAGIMDRSFTFVDHADIVPDYYLPTHNRYAITPSYIAPVAERLVDDYRFVLSREYASHQLTDLTSHFSRGSNRDAMLGTRGEYRYGKADFVTFTEYTRGRSDGLVAPGAPKILINPEPWNLPRRFQTELWENTMVVFFESDKLYNQFREHPFFAKIKEMESTRIMNTRSERNLRSVVNDFMGEAPLFEVEATLDQIRDDISGRNAHADMLAEAAVTYEPNDPGRPFEDPTREAPGPPEVPSRELPVDPEFKLGVFVAYETGQLGMGDSPLRVIEQPADPFSR